MTNVRRFLARVRDQAATKNLDIFAVAGDRATGEGASIYSARGQAPAIRHARRAHERWERAHGVDPRHDWSKTASFFYLGVVGGMEKVARVRGDVKQYRRAYEMFSGRAADVPMFHGTRNLKGIVGSGKIKAMPNPAEGRAVFWNKKRPQWPFFHGGETGGKATGGIISSRSKARPVDTGRAHGGEVVSRGDYTLRRRDYVVGGAGQKGTMREAQRRHRMRPMDQETMLAASQDAENVKRGVRPRSRFADHRWEK